MLMLEEPLAETESIEAMPDRGDRALADMLIAERLVTAQVIEPFWRQTKSGKRLPLIQCLIDQQIAKAEDILIVVAQKSGLAYLPLSQYELDRDIVGLLPAQFCHRHCLAPFDRIGRAVLIAIANPFDEAARRQAQAKLGCRVFWYISSPAEITAALQQNHRTNP